KTACAPPHPFLLSAHPTRSSQDHQPSLTQMPAFFFDRLTRKLPCGTLLSEARISPEAFAAEADSDKSCDTAEALPLPLSLLAAVHPAARHLSAAGTPRSPGANRIPKCLLVKVAASQAAYSPSSI